MVVFVEFVMNIQLYLTTGQQMTTNVFKVGFFQNYDILQGMAK